MSGTFEIDGQRFHAFNGGPMFKFSEAVSCPSIAKHRRKWTRCGPGSPRAARSKCGWLKDKFGLSWKIIPSVPELLEDKDPEKAKRVMQAMMGMVKIDIAGIERAYAG